MPHNPMFQNGAEKGLFLGSFPIPAPQSLAPLLSLWFLSAQNSIFIIPRDHALFLRMGVWLIRPCLVYDEQTK